jgi:hypothetical protein
MVISANDFLSMMISLAHAAGIQGGSKEAAAPAVVA